MTLSDYPPHALIAGPSGTGKTNLIYAWMGALAARYSPAELAFYLLDFKEGVSFARFAPGRRDPSWLPHVRLVGVNVNTDREFGLALLRFLGAELRRRADAAKRHEVTNLAELRAEDPDGTGRGSSPWSTSSRCCSPGGTRSPPRRSTCSRTWPGAAARRASTWCWPARTCPASRRCGAGPRWSRSSRCGSRCPGPGGCWPRRTPAAESLPRYHAVVNADSGRGRGEPDRPGAGGR